MLEKCPPAWGGTGQDLSPDAGTDGGEFLGDIPPHQPVHAGNVSYVPKKMPLQVRRVVLPVSPGKEHGGGHSFLNSSLEDFIPPSLPPPGIPWPSRDLFLNQTIQRRCPGWGEALPSAVDHLFVQEKKHP